MLMQKNQQALDQLTRSLSAFGSFAELISDSLVTGYTPTIRVRDGFKQRVLADAFDLTMARLESTTRAYRG